MGQKQKMNALFIIGFILAIISVAAAGAAAYVAYEMNKEDIAAIIGGAAALAAFVGIILAYCSKTRVKKRKKHIDNPDDDVI